jgi:transposase
MGGGGSASEGAGKFNALTYEAFLRQLLERITVPIILIEDGASYHRSQALDHRLPAFSPQFNPIEKLWKNTGLVILLYTLSQRNRRLGLE